MSKKIWVDSLYNNGRLESYKEIWEADLVLAEIEQIPGLKHLFWKSSNSWVIYVCRKKAQQHPEI